MEVKPGFHIVVSDGDVPASTGTWRRCIGDTLKSWTDLNFFHLDWDVSDSTETSATSPKKLSHIIVSDGDMTAMNRGHSQSWTELNFSNLDWDVGNTTGTSATSPKKLSLYHRKRPSSIADPLTGTRPRHLRRYGNQTLMEGRKYASSEFRNAFVSFLVVCFHVMVLHFL